jgi:hypothetical protein
MNANLKKTGQSITNCDELLNSIPLLVPTIFVALISGSSFFRFALIRVNPRLNSKVRHIPVSCLLDLRSSDFL